LAKALIYSAPAPRVAGLPAKGKESISNQNGYKNQEESDPSGDSYAYEKR